MQLPWTSNVANKHQSCGFCSILYYKKNSWTMKPVYCCLLSL